MPVIIGSARLGENGKITGGKAGDQKQTSTELDVKGEVSMQEFYVHSKGWYVLRPKSRAVGNKIAQLMKDACNNSCLGYNQNDRLGVIKYGIHTRVKTNCDCSSLIRACVKEATGKDPGNFTTANLIAFLLKTNCFENPISYTATTTLYPGDVLVTKTKGHTAAVVEADEVRVANDTKKSIAVIAQEVIDGKWYSGAARKKALTAAGYNYAEVQAKVNALLKAK